MEYYLVIAGTLGGMFVVPGAGLGIYEAVRQVFGYSNPRLFGDIDNSRKLGLFPTIFIQIGLLNFLHLGPFISHGQYAIIGIMFFVICLQVSLRELTNRTRRNIAIVASDIILWGVLGGQDELIMGSVAGAIAGGIIALFEIYVIQTLVKSAPERNYHIFPFWITGILPLLVVSLIIGTSYSQTGEFEEAMIVMLAIYGIGGLILFLFTIVCVPLTVLFIRKVVSFLLSKSLISLKYKSCQCQHCLRYTHPLKSTYRVGHRFCEHCQREVECADKSGKEELFYQKIPPQVYSRFQRPVNLRMISCGIAGGLVGALCGMLSAGLLVSLGPETQNAQIGFSVWSIFTSLIGIWEGLRKQQVWSWIFLSLVILLFLAAGGITPAWFFSGNLKLFPW